MNADGSNPINLTNHRANGTVSPAWELAPNFKRVDSKKKDW